MEKFMSFLEEKMVPIAGKLDQNRYLTAIKNTFIGAMPLFIIGSFFVLIAYLPIPGFADFMLNTFGESWQRTISLPNEVTMSMMTIYVVIGLSSNLSKSYHLDSMGAIFAALAAFLMATPVNLFAVEGTGNGIPVSALGSSGLFVGMLCAVLSVELLHFADKRGWKIKMPDSVPANVSTSFSTLIPILFVTLVFFAIRLGFSATSYGTLQSFIFSNLQKPLTSLGATLPALIIVMLVGGVLWTFGIHGGNIVGGIMQPVWLALTAENAEAIANGLPAPNIINFQFYNNFTKIGGWGATFGLCIFLLFFAKSQQFKAIGKLSILPTIFTINEPITFGLPIVMNPILMLPYIICPVVMAIVAYVSMDLGLVPYPNGVNIPWTTPPIIAGFLVSGWQGAVLNVVQIILSLLIYFPFAKAADMVALKAERIAAEKLESAETELEANRSLAVK
jgi:PTS system cellobiose-specific IIC component